MNHELFYDKTPSHFQNMQLICMPFMDIHYQPPLKNNLKFREFKEAVWSSLI